MLKNTNKSTMSFIFLRVLQIELGISEIVRNFFIYLQQNDLRCLTGINCCRQNAWD